MPVTIFESSLFRTTSTLISGQDYILLIDPNWLPIEVKKIRDYIEEVKGSKSCYLAFTHSDYDHIIGYKAFEGFHTIASRNFVEQPDKKTIIQQIQDFDDGNYIKRSYDIVYPDIEKVIDGDLQSRQLGEDTYMFYQACGHNRDGILIHNISQNILVVGDYMSNIEFPYVYHSFAEYLITLDKIEAIVHAHSGIQLITGHGDPTEDILEIEKRLRDARAYILDLKSAVERGVEFDFDTFVQAYDFPRTMAQFHKENLRLMKVELGVNV